MNKSRGLGWEEREGVAGLTVWLTGCVGGGGNKGRKAHKTIPGVL